MRVLVEIGMNVIPSETIGAWKNMQLCEGN
jgi:hypothetical protein